MRKVVCGERAEKVVIKVRDPAAEQLEEQRATGGVWEHVVKAHQDSGMEDKLEQTAQFESKFF